MRVQVLLFTRQEPKPRYPVCELGNILRFCNMDLYFEYSLFRGNSRVVPGLIILRLCGGADGSAQRNLV